MTLFRFPGRCTRLARVLVLISILFSLGKPAEAALPPGWSDADIGSPGLAGSASENNGNWTVTGGGSDIWNNADQFNFASTTLGSDGVMIVRVLSLQNTDPWSKAGPMFRNDASAGSANAALFATAGNGVSFQWRTTAGQGSLNSSAGSITAPVWLQLARSGGTFTGYYSSDGTNWTQVGTASILMSGSVQAGGGVPAPQYFAPHKAAVPNIKF